MKRFFALLTALLYLSFTAFAETDTDFHVSVAKEMSVAIGELVNDSAYREFVGVQRLTDSIDSLADVDFSAPLHMTMYPITDAMYGTQLPTDLSDAAAERIRTTLPMSILMQINAAQGVEAVAAASSLSVTRTYAMTDTDCILLVQLDGAWVGIAFVQTGDDSLTVTAYPMFTDPSEAFGELPLEAEELF